MTAQPKPLAPNMSILAMLGSEQRLIQLQEALVPQHHTMTHCASSAELLEMVLQRKAPATVDCLLLDAEVVTQEDSYPELFAKLRRAGVFLPTVMLSKPKSTPIWYHQAEVEVELGELSEVGHHISTAIKQFLQLSPDKVRWEASLSTTGQFPPSQPESSSPAFLLEQQQRLASKLKERLGYLGVYYKRSVENFYRNLSEREQQQLLDELTVKYQAILLAYFSEATQINGLIDEFVNLSFFTDISVTQIVEIHMKLIDGYSKQLKLEGRSEAVLVNYRLALLDIISHLCEMYRRSIPQNSSLPTTS